MRYLSASLAFALLLGTMPALAAADPATGQVTAVVHVAGTDLNLSGLDATAAASAIAVACATPTLAPLTVVAASITTTLNVAGAVTLDVNSMVTAAVDATSETTITPTWVPSPAAIAAFVSGIAKKVNRAPVNAKRTVVKSRLKLTAQVGGVAVDQAGAVSAISAAITEEIAAVGTAQTVTVPTAALVAKVTTANIGKAILVVIHERNLYLYNRAAIQKKFRCAPGQPRYPTPKGVWKIVQKVKNPVWHNPWAKWSMKMPAVIRSGRNNPLGTRALYLNAPGIRIHGIPPGENSSIGRAASHGCIRLNNANAIILFPLVSVGTPVYIVK